MRTEDLEQIEPLGILAADKHGPQGIFWGPEPIVIKMEFYMGLWSPPKKMVENKPW